MALINLYIQLGLKLCKKNNLNLLQFGFMESIWEGGKINMVR